MWIVFFVLMAAPMPGHDANDVPYVGRSIVEVLESHRSHGVNLIYNSRLVPDTLRVLREPDARTVPEVIVEILAPHALSLSRVADNHYAVVALRSEDSEPAVDIPWASSSRDELGEVVVVTSSRYRLASEDPSSSTFLTQRQIENLPRPADDPLGAVERLPGVASSRLSVLGHIRGGEQGETQVVLNGLALHAPFHVKDFMTPESVLNSRLVESMEVYTGGFTAEYGNRLSAIVEAETLSDTEHHELGLSLYHLAGLTGGRFAGGGGRYLMAIRRHADHEPAQLRDDVTIEDRGVNDGFAQVSYSVTDATHLTLNALVSEDRIPPVRLSEGEMAHGRYSNRYVWASVQHDWSSRLRGRWLTSLTTGDHSRAGEANALSGGLIRMRDIRSYEVLGLKFDGEYDGERLQQSWGIEGRSSHADYRYTSSAGRDTALTPTGSQYGLYASGRLQLSPRLTAEVGLRWDRQTYADLAQTPGVEQQFSPRVNLLFRPDEATRLRASWGRYFQPQSVDEVQVEDGVERLFPAQRADHIIVSLERDISPLMQLRIEAYRKEYSQLKPRYENLFDPMVLLPELQDDRVQIAPDAAQVRAIEVLLRARDRSPWNWWLSYTLSRAVDWIDDREERRSWDQPHAVQAGLNRSGNVWEWTLAASWHSGWPRTLLTPVDAQMDSSGFAAGPRNAARFGDFAALDVRISRRIPLAKGDLLVSAGSNNVFGRENECCVAYTTMSGTSGPVLIEQMRYWLPQTYSLGVLWKF